MKNPLVKFKDNPGPVSRPSSGSSHDETHAAIWDYLFHIDKRQAVTDERTRFNTWALGAIALLHMATFGLIITIVGILIT